LLGVINSSSPFDWSKFKRDHNKQYASVAEEAKRKEIFLENVNRIHSYRQTYPNATFTLGINHLADRRIEVNRKYISDLSVT
jgi:ribosomal protein L20